MWDALIAVVLWIIGFASSMDLKTKIADRNPTIPRFAQISHLRTPLLIGIFIKPLETFHRCSEDFMSQISIVYLYFFRLSVHHEIATCCDERKIKLKPSFLSDACSSCTSIPVVFSICRMSKSTSCLCFGDVSMGTHALLWNNKLYEFGSCHLSNNS